MAESIGVSEGDVADGMILPQTMEDHGGGQCQCPVPVPGRVRAFTFSELSLSVAIQASIGEFSRERKRGKRQTNHHPSPVTTAMNKDRTREPVPTKIRVSGRWRVRSLDCRLEGLYHRLVGSPFALGGGKVRSEDDIRMT